MHRSIGNLVELLNKCINGRKYRGISRAYGIPYRRFTYRGIPFIPVYRATLFRSSKNIAPILIGQCWFNIGLIGYSLLIMVQYYTNIGQLFFATRVCYGVELPPTSRLKKLVDYEKISRLLVD
jgi:hypothetical protein